MSTNNELDLRSMVALLTSRVNNMCNATTTEDVATEFIKVKDLLIDIYKRNVERTQ